MTQRSRAESFLLFIEEKGWIPESYVPSLPSGDQMLREPKEKPMRIKGPGMTDQQRLNGGWTRHPKADYYDKLKAAGHRV